MTHAHHSDVDTRGAGGGSGFAIAVLALLVLAAVAFAVLWTQPWDDSSNTNNDVAPITDNIVPDNIVPDGGGDSVPVQPAE